MREFLGLLGEEILDPDEGLLSISVPLFFLIQSSCDPHGPSGALTRRILLQITIATHFPLNSRFTIPIVPFSPW